MSEKVLEQSIVFEAKPSGTFEPDAGSFYDSWMHFHENAVSEPYYPNNTPLITIDPKYQGIYDYWVQRRKETPKPLTLVEKIDQIKQDHLSSSAITYTAFTMILIGVLLLFLARKFIDKGAQNRSLMTERAEGVIKTINRNKRNNNQCGIVSFKYRGQIYEKEYVLPIGFEEGRKVEVIFDPSNINRSMIDIQNERERNPFRIAAWILFMIGIAILVWMEF